MNWLRNMLHRRAQRRAQQATHFGAPRERQPNVFDRLAEGCLTPNLGIAGLPFAMFFALLSLAWRFVSILCVLVVAVLALWGVLRLFGFGIDDAASLPSPVKLAVAARNAGREFAKTAGEGVLFYPGKTRVSEHARVTRVIEGDVVEVEIVDGKGNIQRRETVRLLGIDAPEVRENALAEEQAKRQGTTVFEILRKGKLAREHAAVLAPHGAIAVLEYDVAEKDAYGYLSGYLWIDFDGNGTLDYMLNQVMLKDGMAVSNMDKALLKSISLQAERALGK
jgi:endonuclease YncB( thermonuclease family)